MHVYMLLQKLSPDSKIFLWHFRITDAKLDSDSSEYEVSFTELKASTEAIYLLILSFYLQCSQYTIFPTLLCHPSAG